MKKKINSNTQTNDITKENNSTNAIIGENIDSSNNLKSTTSPYKNNYSSIITNRLSVSKTIDTTYSEEEEAIWQDIKYNLSLDEKARKKQIIGYFVVFAIMIIGLILLLIWWFNKYYGYLF